MHNQGVERASRLANLGLSSEPMASASVLGDQSLKLLPSEAATTKKEHVFAFDLRFLERIQRDDLAQQVHESPESCRIARESCEPQDAPGSAQQVVSQHAATPVSLTHTVSPDHFQSPFRPLNYHEDVALVTEDSQAPRGSHGPVFLDPASIHTASDQDFCTYNTAPPRMAQPSPQADDGSICLLSPLFDVSVEAVHVEAEPTPAVPPQGLHIHLAAQTPVGGVPEYRSSALVSTPSPALSPLPPPTHVGGVPEDRPSAFAPGVPCAPSRSPTPPTEFESPDLGSPPSPMAGVPEARPSAWAPAPLTQDEAPVLPVPDLVADGLPEETDEPESPVLALRQRIVHSSSHSFHVPDHPLLLRSNPSPVPLSPRSRLVAESERISAQEHTAAADDPEHVAGEGLLSQASTASISLNGGVCQVENEDAAQALGAASIHAKLDASTSPMPWFYAPSGLTPEGCLNVAAETTPGLNAGEELGEHSAGGDDAAQVDCDSDHQVKEAPAQRCTSGVGCSWWFGAQQDPPGPVDNGYDEDSDEPPEDPCAPPSSKWLESVAASAQLAAHASTTPALQEFSQRKALVVAHADISAAGPVQDQAMCHSGTARMNLSTGGTRHLAGMLGWGAGEATVRDHVMRPSEVAAVDGLENQAQNSNLPAREPSQGANCEDVPETRNHKSKAPRKTMRARSSRRSLAGLGLAERDGTRRSTRKRMPPLRWYLGENVTYKRTHRSLPTIVAVGRTDQQYSAYNGYHAQHHVDKR